MNRRAILILVALVLLLAVGAVWLIPAHKVVRSFKLPDGTTLSVYQVTYGTNHELIYANDWRDRFARFVPAKYATNLGFKRTRLALTQYNSNNLVVWMNWSGATPASSVPFPRTMLPRVSVTVVDDNGLEASTSTTTVNGTFMVWSLPNYPRRSRIIHLRYWDTSTPAAGGSTRPRLLAELGIPNPARNTAAPWVADGLPAVRVTNGLEIALLNLETGYSATRAELPSGGFVGRRSGFRGGGFGRDGIGGISFVPSAYCRSYSLARVELRENGQPTTAWSVQGLQAVAPSGTSVMMPGISHPASAGGSDYYFTGVFWREEPVWDVTVALSRQSDFPAEETWKIGGIPVPGAGGAQDNSVATETNLSGVYLVFLGLSSTATPAYSFLSGSNTPTFSQSSSPGAWTMNLTMTNYSSDVQFMLQSLQTDTGETVQETGYSLTIVGTRAGAAPTATYGFSLQVPDGTKTLDATFVVSQPRYVKFRVKPTLAH